MDKKIADGVKDYFSTFLSLLEDDRQKLIKDKVTAIDSLIREEAPWERITEVSDKLEDEIKIIENTKNFLDLNVAQVNAQSDNDEDWPFG